MDFTELSGALNRATQEANERFAAVGDARERRASMQELRDLNAQWIEAEAPYRTLRDQWYAVYPGSQPAG